MARNTEAQLTNLLFLAVSGQEGELPWSSLADTFLNAAEEEMGLNGRKRLTRQQALAIIDYAAYLARHPYAP